MIRTLTQSMVALSLLAAPIAASAKNDDRRYVDRGEVQDSRERVREERRDYKEARRYGNRNDVRKEQRDLRRAQGELARDRQDLQRARGYDWNRPDPRYGRYYANNYYRDGSTYNYRPYRLSANDRVYRGNDNRYYCRRADGTTGLLIGAIGGGVLGDAIAPGGSKTLGAVLGVLGGGALGRSIDRNNVSCR